MNNAPGNSLFHAKGYHKTRLIIPYLRYVTTQTRHLSTLLSSIVATTTAFSALKQSSSFALINLHTGRRTRTRTRYATSHPPIKSPPSTPAFAILHQDNLLWLALVEYQELYTYRRIQCQGARNIQPEWCSPRNPHSSITTLWINPAM